MQHLYLLSKWVSDCCLTPCQQILSYIMARKKLLFDPTFLCLFCTRPTCLVGLIVLAH